MRTNIIDIGAGNLKYEIRKIVEIAEKVRDCGIPIVWENIGDPIAKGERVPTWIKEYVAQAVTHNSVYAYSPTKGLLSTRTYIANERNKEGGIRITPEDILFFNGLGDAISKLYKNLHTDVRVIGPNPAYPTHASAEAAHAGREHITYALNPKNGWQPDLDDMEQKIRDNPWIAGILIVNPDNPTGFVYAPDTLKKIVALAKKYELFIISDEIYSNLVYPDVPYVKLAQVIEDVPAIAMRGISKEFPWPGARCGWIEFYNRGRDSMFDAYAQSIIDAKMLEVCSTTLPQAVLPDVMSDARYYPELRTRTEMYKHKSEIAYEILRDVPSITMHMPQGAFYFTVVFDDAALNATQTLPLTHPEVSALIDELTKETSALDKRFTYYLLGATGICVVPLTTGFNASCFGFRATLLEQDVDVFRDTMIRLREAIRVYLAS
ncbi:MAG TPA: pyridoxal phosphate-dependent aminotransferase [Candidatus Paceibacterota bacterium]|nr:pyridoxal phosphate-dependent aminotransferase [Candidatus Paceibacterota bacterium]